MELKVVVTNPKTKEEYDLMIKRINKKLNEKYGQVGKELKK